MNRAVRIPAIGVLLCCAVWAGSYVGLSVADLTPERAQSLHLIRGVEILGVEPRSPAATAGLKAHDVLIAVNGENLAGTEQLARMIQDVPPGRRLKLQYWRNGSVRQIELFTASRPDAVSPDTSFPFPTFDSFGLPVDIPAPLIIWRNTLLGIEGEPLTPPLASYFGAEHGLFIRDVRPGSPADKSGLRTGDIVVEAGERPVLSTRDLTEALRAERTAPKKTVALVILRDHKHMMIGLSVIAQ